MLVCDVSWPLKALKTLCHGASRKLAQRRCNRKVFHVGGRLGCCAPVWVCALCVDGCVCVYWWSVFNAFVWPCMHACDCLFSPFVGVLSCVNTEPYLWVCVSLFMWVYVLALLSKWAYVCVCVCVCVSICLSETEFPGLKCQLSTIFLLCDSCSVRLRLQQTVLIYRPSTDGGTSWPQKWQVTPSAAAVRVVILEAAAVLVVVAVVVMTLSRCGCQANIVLLNDVGVWDGKNCCYRSIMSSVRSFIMSIVAVI